MNIINTFKAPCPTCKVECNTLVHGEKKQEWADVFEERYHVYGEVEHKLLECCGCGTVFYYKDSWDSEGGGMIVTVILKFIMILKLSLHKENLQISQNGLA